MVVDFSKLDMRERPVLILENTTGTPIGLLGSAKNVTLDIKYNETSTVEFDVPAYTDGVATHGYNAVIGMRVVDVQDVGKFILVNPQETGDGVKRSKTCKGYSLEYEFTFKKLTLDNATYNFWNPVTPDGTLLDILLEQMPTWSIGTVDKDLIGKYRTFEVADENLYNFIKGTVQTSYNCIFDFDTYQRKINVRSCASTVPVNPVYLSTSNLAKEISVTEDTENIVTRLDVNGADGVNIRDVNPSGTNTIINLDYFMTPDNFSQEIIDKYDAWKTKYENYQLPYYNLSIEYALQVMRSTTEKAALTELESELTILENEQAVVIQGIAQNLKEQADLDDVNTRITGKQAEIDAKKAEITAIDAQAACIFDELKVINTEANFKNAFTAEEYLLLDRYLKDDAVSESSFVAQTTDTYTNGNMGSAVTNSVFSVQGAAITKVTNAQGKDIYDITGGNISADIFSGEVIKAAFEKSSNGSFIMTAYLSKGTSGDRDFPKGCVSLTGTVADVVTDVSGDGMQEGIYLQFTASDGYLYFTMNTSEYEKRAVAWELFSYGKEVLQRLSQPSYTFSITSANFLCLDDFIQFKNSLRHGEKIYVALGEDETLSPICIGARFSFDAMNELELEFGDTYTSGDNSFLLADLLDQSVSMGKNVDLNKYNYSAFMDSGASTRVKEFIDSALDVSKNAIMSSKDQAISWSDSGIRLRKWTDETHTTYDPKQVWMNNNTILMTSNNWNTAELAIGNFYDANLGDCWGVVAPNIVGTLLAGKNLVIESEKEDGGVAVFKVDADGCVLHNSTLSVTSEDFNSHILLDPEHGLMIGVYPLVNNKGEIDEDKKLFYADTNGNLTLKGTIYATNGEFKGKVTATSGYIGNETQGWTIIDNAIYNGKPTFSDSTEGIYIGVDGISLGTDEKYIRANKNGYLLANYVDISGRVTAKEGYIGDGENGWTIGSTAIYNGKTALSSDEKGIYIGVDGISIKSGDNYITLDGSTGQLTANNAVIRGEVYATSGTFTGTVNAEAGVIGGCTIADGMLQIMCANIQDTIVAGAINLSEAVISGTMSASYIKGGTIDADTINVTNLNAANLSKGFINSARISDSSNALENLYVTNGYFDNIQMYRGTLKFTYASGAASEGSIEMSGTGIGYGGKTYSWADIVTGATAETKTAVFG